MTNNLPAGDYTVIFEIFAANIVSASNITFLTFNRFMEMLIIKLLLFLMIIKLHIANLIFNSLQMETLEISLLK